MRVDLVTLLRDDRHLADLVEQPLGEPVDLGRRSPRGRRRRRSSRAPRSRAARAVRRECHGRIDHRRCHLHNDAPSPFRGCVNPRVAASGSRESQQPSRSAPQRARRRARPVRPEMVVAHHHVTRQPREVRQRQHVRDRPRNPGYFVGVKNVPGDDRHRQVDEVDDGRRAFGRADVAGERRDRSPRTHAAPSARSDEAARTAARAAPTSKKSSRPIAMISAASIRKTTNVETSTATQIDRRRQRRRADALEHAALAADHHRDREPGERGRRDAVADHPRLEERRAPRMCSSEMRRCRRSSRRRGRR